MQPKIFSLSHLVMIVLKNSLFFIFFSNITLLFLILIRFLSDLQIFYKSVSYIQTYILMEQSTLKLRTGDQMPIVGLGTWKIPNQSCTQVVYQALKAGYRLLDCACDYGNEQEVGQGIKKAIDEGILTRKDLWVTSKLWNTFHRPQHVELACRKSLQDLSLQYLDLYLIHFPISIKFVDPNERYPPEWLYFDENNPNPCMIQDPVPIAQTWKAMEELVKKGLVRNIGVSNFGAALLRDLINSSTIKPAVLQIELHPNLTQKKLIKYCHTHNIQITCYSSFGGASYVQLGGVKQDQSFINNETVKKIAKTHKKSPAQVLLRWAVQQSLAVIPKSIKVERLQQNRDILSWSLTEQEMKELDGLNKNKRYNDPGVYCEEFFGLFFPIFD